MYFRTRSNENARLNNMLIVISLFMIHKVIIIIYLYYSIIPLYYQVAYTLHGKRNYLKFVRLTLCSSRNLNSNNSFRFLV